MSRAGLGCQRPDCDGTYEDVGGGELSCDICGPAPVVSADGPTCSVPTVAAGPGLGPSSTAAAGPGRGAPPAAGAPGSTGASRSRRPLPVRGSSSASGSSGRGRLGAGLVQVPRVPRVPRPGPRSMVLHDPEVPERKRFCSRSRCGAPVGRARGGRPGRTEGFCTACGHPYSFVPGLEPGNVVHGQYEVVGCLAHGGLGWIHLAVDRAVSDRWVVLKGLLDTGDQDAMAAAVSERRFPAEIEHPTIVPIHTFVEHLNRRSGSLDGYIVREYVGGGSPREIADARRAPDGRRDPLPVEQACAYGLEALEALGHLHGQGLLYCDVKPDNALRTEDRLKLIDMGAVRRTDDRTSAVYGTVGYQAPEIAEAGPSVASDLYTVGRTLAVLTFDVRGFTTVHAHALPGPDTVEVFRRHAWFHRLLLRVTDPDPARRFASAEEMAEQLTGVLREVASVRTGRSRPVPSTLCGPELKVPDTEVFPPLQGDVSRLGARPARRRRSARRPAPASGAPTPVEPVDAAAALALPVPHVAPADPHAGFLAGLSASAPGEQAAALDAVPEPSAETRLRHRRPEPSDTPFPDDLTAAAAQVEALEAQGLDPLRRELLATEVLGCAPDWVLSGGRVSGPASRRVLLGSDLDERGLRFGLERSSRTPARLASGGEERIDLVERANRYRPRTWV
ncbi:serine/threonine protein kinase [Streptomyces thermodiastaticus]